MTNMDLRQLRHFVAIAETLHFGRAADRLGMTQPPLSQSLKALEQEIGVRLFDRTKRSVALTPVGAAWLPLVNEALAKVAALPLAASHLREDVLGTLELSFVSIADYNVLPDLVRRYAARYPNVDLRLREATTDVQIEALLAGRGDAGIVVAPAKGSLPAALDYRRLLVEPLVAALPERWIDDGRLRLKHGRVSGADLAKAPLIIFPRRVSAVFYDLIVDYLSGKGGAPQVAQEAIQMQTIISLVSADMGVALVPSALRNLARPGVRYVELNAPTPPTLETGIVWHRSNLSPTLSQFLATAAE